ncbi:MAG: efflux RND transporter periplasmic adaptor subunit, partial [Bacillota bacterium]
MWWVLGLVVVIGAAGWVWAGRRSSPAGGDAGYLAVAVRRGPIEVVASADGVLQAVDRRELRASTGGRVVRVLVKEGEVVQPGQVLVELDRADLLARLEKAEVSLEQAKRELASLVGDRQKLAVKAPVAGRVVSLRVAEGQRVSAGSAVATVVDDRHLEVTGYFTRVQIDSISTGQAASVFVLDYISEVPGTVVRVGRASQPGSGGGALYPVVVQLENPGALKAGMAAEVRVQTPEGTVRAVEASVLQEPAGRDIVAGVGGTVTAVAVREGEHVEAGQVLAELSGDDLEEQVALQELKVKQAQLDVESLGAELAGKTVVAPCGGTVTSLPVKEGEYVGQGGVVAVLVDPGRLEAVVKVDEVDVVKVRGGQEAVVTADAFPGQEFRGEVSEVAVEGKQEGGVGVYDVTVLVHEPGELRQGMTCHVKIKVASKADALLVPVEALQTAQGGYRVWVASPGEGSGAAGSSRGGSGALQGARPVSVKVGLVSTTMAEITEGLKEGDLVLVPSRSGSQSVPRMP